MTLRTQAIFGCPSFGCLLICILSILQDLTAINVTKTGHRKKVLSESAKLESRMVFPNGKPVSFYNRLCVDSSIISGTESTVTERVKYPYMTCFPESRVSFELSRQLGRSNETLLAG